MPAPQIKTKAIVLRRTNYGEADRVLQLLTPDYGKLSAIAKGVRREKSKLAGGIELFAICDVTIISGKREIGTLTSARLDTFFAQIMKDYQRMQFAYEVIKQVGKATDGINEPAFYHLLEVSYRSLDNIEIDLRIIETWFWLQLAILLGVGLNLSIDANGNKLVAGERYEFDISESALYQKQTGRFTTDHIKLLRVLSAHSPHVAAQVQGLNDLIPDCLWLARQAAAH